MPGRKSTAAEKSFAAMNQHKSAEEIFAEIFDPEPAAPAATIPAADPAATAPPAILAGGAQPATTAPATGAPPASVVPAAVPAARTLSASKVPAAATAAGTPPTRLAAVLAAGNSRARTAPAADLAAGAQPATSSTVSKPVAPPVGPKLASTVFVPPHSGMIAGMPTPSGSPPKSPKMKSQVIKPTEAVTIDSSSDEEADPASSKPRRRRHPTPPSTRLAKPVSPAPPAEKKPRKSKCDQPAPAAKPGAVAPRKRADLARSVHAKGESEISESDSDLSAVAGSDPLIREAAAILDDSDVTDERSRTPSPEPDSDANDDCSDEDGNAIKDDDDVEDESDTDGETELNPLQKKILSDAYAKLRRSLSSKSKVVSLPKITSRIMHPKALSNPFPVLSVPKDASPKRRPPPTTRGSCLNFARFGQNVALKHFFGSPQPGQQPLLQMLTDSWKISKEELIVSLSANAGRKRLRNAIRRLKLYNVVTGLYARGAYPLNETVKDARAPFGSAMLKDYLKEQYGIKVKGSLPLINHGALRLPIETFYAEPPKASSSGGEAVAELNNLPQVAEARPKIGKPLKAGQKRKSQK